MSAGRLCMGLDVIELALDEPYAGQRYLLVDVERRGGPRDGGRMGWAVIDAGKMPDLISGFDLHVYPTEAEAVAEIERLESSSEPSDE